MEVHFGYSMRQYQIQRGAKRDSVAFARYTYPIVEQDGVLCKALVSHGAAQYSTALFYAEVGVNALHGLRAPRLLSPDWFLSGLGLARTASTCAVICFENWADIGGDVPTHVFCFKLWPACGPNMNEDT